jgi:glycosyltransferase involved in cell wall biosynthesis
MESYVTAYVKHFRTSRATRLFSLRPGPNTLTNEVDGYAEGAASNRRMYGAYFRYCRQHRKERFHVLNCGPVVLLITLLAGARRPVYHIHGTLYWKGRLDRWALRAVWFMTMPFRPLFVANSAFTADSFRRTAIPVRPIVVYNGFDTAPLLATRRRRTRVERMGYVGRMAEGKNAELAVRAFNAIAARNNEVHLHIAGTGAMERLVWDEVLMSPFRRRIHFHGWVADMPAFYTSMDLVVFPSSHESFGNVLAEALINGLPALVSDLPSFAEIHGDRKTFCLGSPEEPTTFIQNFVSAMERYDTLAEQAYAASDAIARRFGMEEHLQAIERIHDAA